MSSKPLRQGSFVMLWAGENPAVHADLLEELQAAGIPFADKSLGDDEVAPTADPLPIDWKPRFGFEVTVLSTDLAAAKEVLEKLLDEEPADVEIPARDDVAAAEPPLLVATETHPAVEIWNGNDDQISTAGCVSVATKRNASRGGNLEWQRRPDGAISYLRDAGK